MGTLSEDLTAIKDVEDTLIANKVARFSYTDTAYANDDADGVDVFNVNNEQNIPNPTASVMKVNPTILNYGYRAQASSITRMLVNHFFGRVSYNLNKINDNMSNLIATLRSHAGTANGFATLDSNGLLVQQKPIGSPYVPITRKFLSAVFGRLFGRIWHTATSAFEPNIYKCVYANGLWVCGSVSNGMWWSEDGKSWTQGTGNNTTYNMPNPAVYANGLWVCGSGSHGMWWSEDGKSWYQESGSSTTYSMGYNGRLVYANGLWVCGSYYQGMWWSEDGKNWIICSGVSTLGIIPFLIYANGLWVCAESDLNEHILAWSEDGKSWIHGTPSGVSVNANGLIYANGLWVCSCSADGDHGGILYSTDGKSWIQGNRDGVPFSNSASCVFYKNGLWLCTDSSGYINYSENGTHWLKTNKALFDQYSFVYYFIYDDGIILAVGNNSITYSCLEDLIENDVIDLGANIPLVNSEE